MELNLWNMAGNACRMIGKHIVACAKKCFKTPDCYYYENGKMYHCLCNRCEQIYCDNCSTTHLTFETSKVRACSLHRPMLQYRSDE